MLQELPSAFGPGWRNRNHYLALELQKLWVLLRGHALMDTRVGQTLRQIPGLVAGMPGGAGREGFLEEVDLEAWTGFE